MARKGGNQKPYQFVDALVEIGTKEVSEGLKVGSEQARQVMQSIARSMCFRFAKTIMYVPADMEFELSQRDSEIWTKYGQEGPDGVRPYTPQRIAQLGEEYKLSVAHLYCIVKLMAKRDLAARQGQLPGFDDAA